MLKKNQHKPLCKCCFFLTTSLNQMSTAPEEDLKPPHLLTNDTADVFQDSEDDADDE
jgi:hypothetical protein